MFRQTLVVLCLVFLGLANALSIEKRIVNGVRADPYEFPSIGSLHYLGKHHCGAVLVSRTKVLTAAHCVYGRKPEDFHVVFGANDIKDPNQQSRSVASFVPHDQYHKGYRKESHNDIAMITLATPVDLNPKVELATLALPGSSFSGETCKIAGWGNTGNDYPTYLQKAYITNIPNYECLRRTGVNTFKHICVLGQDEAAGTAPGACDADSGGPLYCGKNFEYVAGLAAWSDGSCFGDFPSVYTRVAEYRDWIEDHM